MTLSRLVTRQMCVTCFCVLIPVLRFAVVRMCKCFKIICTQLHHVLPYAMDNNAHDMACIQVLSDWCGFFSFSTLAWQFSAQMETSAMCLGISQVPQWSDRFPNELLCFTAMHTSSTCFQFIKLIEVENNVYKCV